MRITKYFHSCLLVDHDEKVLLIDPGNYSFESKLFPLDSLEKLDYIVITHSHEDHCSIPFIRALVAKFPAVKIISTDEVVTLLIAEKIPVSTESDAVVSVSPLPHEKLFDATVPENIQVDILGLLSHPGDSFQSTKTKKVFALPMQAPWGCLVQAIHVAIKLKPTYIIPIHDFQWKDDFKHAMYLRCEGLLAHYGITFLPLEDGKPFDIA